MMQLPRESRTIEYKREVSDFKKIAKTAIGFANGSGGEIVIGVDDKTRAVRGLDSITIDDLHEKLPVSLLDQIRPELLPLIYSRTIEDKEVLIIQVFTGSQKPYFLASEGAEKGVYVRVGAHTRRAEGEALEELKLIRSRIEYDEAPIPGCSVEQLDLALLPASLRSKKALFSLDVLFQHPHSGEVYPTRGGVVMLCDQAARYVSGAETIVSRMRGGSGRDTIESHEFLGTLVSQAEQALELLLSWLGREPKLKKNRYLNSDTRLPVTALREAIHNALFHRQYSIPGPTKIALYADRLEIFSPGHFAGPFLPASLGDGTSYIRNRVICLLARRMGLIEKRGTGIQAIFTSCQEMNLKPPQFEEGPNWFKVTLFTSNAPGRTSANSPPDIIRGLFETNVSVTSAQVMKAVGVSKATAVKYLEQLIQEGFIKRTGQGPKTRYLVVG